jgi:hypothetical protein
MTRPGRMPVLTTRPVAFVAAVLAATALGGWRAESIAATRPDPSTLVVEGVSYRVTHAQQIQGLSDSALGGMSHGIQNLVTDDKALISVTVVVSTGDSPGTYDARSLGAFAPGSRVGFPSVGGMGSGQLKAHASIEGFLAFIVPRKGGQFALKALDDTREVPLLTVDQAPAGAGPHQHTSPAPTTSATSTPATSSPPYLP